MMQQKHKTRKNKWAACKRLVGHDIDNARVGSRSFNIGQGLLPWVCT